MTRTVSGPPWLFQVAKRLIRSDIPGGYRLIQLAGRLGMLDVVVCYTLPRGIRFSVPLYRAENRWDVDDLLRYESEFVRAFSDIVRTFESVTLFDCGADIGAFSALTVCRAGTVARIVAFEPNADVFPLLESNLSALPASTVALLAATSSFEGSGRLERPPYDASEHARYLVPGDGPLSVTTIDSQGVRGKDIAIKIDVEGGELDVLKGAVETIRSARRCVVAFEAHPKVAARTGRDPVECLRLLESIRPFRFRIAETGAEPSAERPLIAQGQTDIWNVVGSAGTE